MRYIQASKVYSGSLEANMSENHPNCSNCEVSEAIAKRKIENELLRDKLDAPALHKGENDDKKHCAIDLEKEVQSNVPPSDPICCFTSNDKEMLHAPTRKAKRLFEEVNFDLKAGEHGSPEDQKRRNSGPSQLHNLHTVHTVQEKEKEPSFDAVRFRASVENDC